MLHWYGDADVPLGSVLGGIMGVPDVAVLVMQKGSVCEELLPYCVHKVVIRALLFLRSGLEEYEERVIRNA